MSDRRFEGSTVIDRPIQEVFDFLAAGVNDPKFSPRVQEIRQTTDGPVGKGTKFASRVKDAGFKTTREFEYTEFVPPTMIRWAERSNNMIEAVEGGYDLEPVGDGQTKLTVYNVLQPKGFIGKLLVGPAVKAAKKDAPAFAERIKCAVESG